MYRGAGMTLLLARYGAPVAVVVTAVAFGLAHGLLLALAALVYFGVVTALLRLKTRSVYPCILVHSLFNATSLDPGRHDLTQRYSRLVRGAIVLLAGLAFTASANAAPPAVIATATPAAGVAPFRVTLAATGDAASYSWALGDGTRAEGPVVTHVYAVGKFVATVTATNSAGEVSQAQVAVTGSRRTVTLGAPTSAGYGEPTVLAGLAASRSQGRPRPDLPRPDLCHVRTRRHERSLPHTTAPAAAWAVPGPLRSGALDRTPRAPPPDDRGLTAGNGSRRLDSDAASPARTRPSRVALRPRLPRRPPRPRARWSREASDREAGRAACGVGLPAARRVCAGSQGGRRAGRTAVSRARLPRPERRRPRAAAGRAPLRTAERSTALTEPTRSKQ